MCDPDELVETLARREHRADMKRRGITPIHPWSRVGTTTKGVYRRRVKETLKAIQRFMERKVVAYRTSRRFLDPLDSA